MRKVVVTAMGIASSLGLSIREFEVGLFSGKSGVTDIRGKTVPRGFPVPYAAVIPRPLPVSPLLSSHSDSSEFTLLAVHVLEQVLESLPDGLALDGFVYGSGGGLGYPIAEKLLTHQANNASLWKQLNAQDSLDTMLEILRLRGHGPADDLQALVIQNACATGNVCIGKAFDRIRTGKWKRAIAGAADLRCEAPYLLSFHLLNALATRPVAPEAASSPFSLGRDGFVKAEGAAMLLLEEEQTALARGAPILGTIEGYGVNSDGWRLTDSREDGRCISECMREALRDAMLDTTDIPCISAHGTSTPMNDAAETRAIKTVFGPHAAQLAITATKSQTGHATTAASAIEAVACLLMLKRQTIAPTINAVADPECDLDYVPNVARKASLSRILSNSFGFGGQNACVVFGAPPRA